MTDDALKIVIYVCGGAAAVGAIVVIWWFLTINRFVHLKNLILESWSNVDVVLRRRYDLIPNLVETVKAYARYESELLQKVADLRAAAMHEVGAVDVQAKVEQRLVESVNQLIARIEAYPDLKASQQYLELQKELVNTEDRIAAARRFYNANVREFNTLLACFPAAFVGRARGLSPAPYFEVSSLEIRKPPNIAGAAAPS